MLSGIQLVFSGVNTSTMMVGVLYIPLCNLGTQAFIFTKPRGASNFMAVARFGKDFQNVLIKQREKTTNDTKLVVAYFKHNGEANNEAYATSPHTEHPAAKALLTLDSPFTSETLMKPFKMIESTAGAYTRPLFSST